MPAAHHRMHPLPAHDVPGSSPGPLRAVATQRPGRGTRRAQGVSLIEALVALAIMSFGMLALVGVQATMRHNTDVARQRTEALRLATDDAEALRNFIDLTPVAGQTYPSWDQIVTANQANLTLPGATANTSFSLNRTVLTQRDQVAGAAQLDAAAMKLVQVQVPWNDRAGNAHTATLNTIIAAAAPALSARLGVPWSTGAVSRRSGRHASIPIAAKDMGNGLSAYKPFDQGTTVWVMNHDTGDVTRVCNGVNASQAAITQADLGNCITVIGRLVTGSVRFDGRPSGVNAAVSETPAGPVLPLDASTPLRFFTGGSDGPVNQSVPATCMADTRSAQTADAGRVEVGYACLVRPADATGWGGRLVLVPGTYASGPPVAWTIGTGAGEYRVCRYTTASTAFTANTDHPDFYCRVASANCTSRVTRNLTHQHFLVIANPNTCPTDTALNAATGDLINSNTLQHQP